MPGEEGLGRAVGIGSRQDVGENMPLEEAKIVVDSEMAVQQPIPGSAARGAVVGPGSGRRAELCRTGNTGGRMGWPARTIWPNSGRWSRVVRGPRCAQPVPHSRAARSLMRSIEPANEGPLPSNRPAGFPGWHRGRKTVAPDDWICPSGSSQNSASFAVGQDSCSSAVRALGIR